MKILKKGVHYVLALLMISATFSCEEDDELNIIQGLDFNIAELNAEGNEIGVIATTIPERHSMETSLLCASTKCLSVDVEEVDFLRDTLNLEKDDIFNVDTKDSFSFFNSDAQLTEFILQTFTDFKVDGRFINVEVSKKPASGGKGGRKRDRKRGHRKGGDNKSFRKGRKGGSGRKEGGSGRKGGKRRSGFY